MPNRNGYTIGESYINRRGGISKLLSIGRCRSYSGKDELDTGCIACGGHSLLFDDEDYNKCQTSLDGKPFFILVQKSNARW